VTSSPPKLIPALLGGLFIGVLSALPFISVANCCCLWVITGGYIAAWLQQKNYDLPITIADGMVVGMLAGLLGGIVHYLTVLPIELYLGSLAAGMSGGFMPARQEMPPELRRVMNELGPQGLLLLGSLFFAVISMVFGTIGGIFGAMMVRKPSPPPPPVPPVRWGAPPSLPSHGAPGSTPPSWPPPPPPPGDEKPPE
jgi:hypothetical protein